MFGLGNIRYVVRFPSHEFNTINTVVPVHIGEKLDIDKKTYRVTDIKHTQGAHTHLPLLYVEELPSEEGLQLRA